MNMAKPALAKEVEERKPGKNEFKCFQCRNITSSKEGDWHSWNAMEVHLCRVCDKTTQNRPERKK
jgi:hypothetical protein